MFKTGLFLSLLLAAQLLPGPGGRLPRRPRPSATPPLPARIDLVLKTAAGETRASIQPGVAPASPRASASARASEKPQIRWSVRNLNPRAAIQNVAVYFLLIKTAGPGSPVPPGPPPRKGAVAESVVGTDLAPRGATSGNYNTPLPEPGVYLVEVELLDPEGTSRQQCMLDLKVE